MEPLFLKKMESNDHGKLSDHFCFLQLENDMKGVICYVCAGIYEYYQTNEFWKTKYGSTVVRGFLFCELRRTQSYVNYVGQKIVW